MRFSFTTGSFSQLRIHFHFKRDLLYFILQSYVPSTFIVMCSWVAFWINRSGIPGRACLSITTVLRFQTAASLCSRHSTVPHTAIFCFSLITLIGSTNAKLPNVSTVKALDVYFGMCFVYVFGGLLEFATVIYLETKEKKQGDARKAKVAPESHAIKVSFHSVLECCVFVFRKKRPGSTGRR